MSLSLVLCISSLLGNSKITVMSASFSPHTVARVGRRRNVRPAQGGGTDPTPAGCSSIRQQAVQVSLVAHLKLTMWVSPNGWLSVKTYHPLGTASVTASHQDNTKDDHPKVSVTRGRYRTMERVQQLTPWLKISAGVSGDCDEGPAQAGTGSISVPCLGCVNSQYVTVTWGQCKSGLKSARNRGWG